MRRGTALVMLAVMAVSSEHPAALPVSEQRSRWSLPRDVWPSLAISVIWLTVLVDALWGPDFVSTSAGGSMTKIPSAIILALFAWLATRTIAKYAFGGRDEDEPPAT